MLKVLVANLFFNNKRFANQADIKGSTGNVYDGKGFYLSGYGYW